MMKGGEAKVVIRIILRDIIVRISLPNGSTCWLWFGTWPTDGSPMAVLALQKNPELRPNHAALQFEGEIRVFSYGVS
jgi:hypothetical protein